MSLNTIEEALSGVDDDLVVLRYLLQAKPDAQLQDFVQSLDDSIDNSIDNVDEVVDILFDLYIKYCGISIGMRTAIWDAMVGCYNYFEPEKEFDEVIALIEARFERRKATEWQNMDIAITSNAFTIARLVSLLDEEPDCKTNIAIALFCFAKTTSTHLLDEI